MATGYFKSWRGKDKSDAMKSQIFKKMLIGVVCLVMMLSSATGVLATQGVDNDCFCRTVLDGLTPDQVKTATDLNNKDTSASGAIFLADCFVAPVGKCEVADTVKPAYQKNLNVMCERQDAKNQCNTSKIQWESDYKALIKQASASGSSTGGSAGGSSPSGPSTISSLIAKCGAAGTLSGGSWKKDCADITVFVSLLLDLVNYLFGIIGALALGVFVYGGFVLIISQGNPEKVKQGTGAMINAVIGMFVAFSGYMLVGYIGEILQLNATFKLLK